MSRLAGKIAAAAGPVVILAAASLAVVSSSHSPPPPAPAASPTSEAAAPSRYWGASVPSPIPAGLRVLAAKVGVKPGIGAYYQRFGSPFRDGPAAAIAKDGAIPLVQWDPVGVKLSRVAAGRRDGYLKSYAAEVRRFRGRVIISFGHEMNGPWWKWGKGHQPAAEFVAAWRHIHDVFKRAGTSNVIWLWNPNVLSGPPVAHFAAWWPGSSYVDWAGLDGYYWRSHYPFASIFARSLAELRGLAPG